MSADEQNLRFTRRDQTRDAALKYTAWALPFVFAILPALVFFVLGTLSGTPPTAIVFFTLAVASLIGGFLVGIIVSGIILYRRSQRLTRLRERLKASGIRTEEVDLFKNELSTNEKKALREIDARDRLLGDAYRETLASRLTAAHILKTSKRELLLVKKRQNKLKYLKSENSAEFLAELDRDRENLEKINTEAGEMQREAETRLQMIEAAATRGGGIAESELALKKLSARSRELPLALEAVKMEDEIRRELEKDDVSDPDAAK